MTVMKGDEFRMLVKMPRGMYFTAKLMMMKEAVPTRIRVISVARSSLGTLVMKFNSCFSYFMMAADATKLNKPRTKTNSESVTLR